MLSPNVSTIQFNIIKKIYVVLFIIIEITPGGKYHVKQYDNTGFTGCLIDYEPSQSVILLISSEDITINVTTFSGMLFNFLHCNY